VNRFQTPQMTLSQPNEMHHVQPADGSYCVRKRIRALVPVCGSVREFPDTGTIKIDKNGSSRLQRDDSRDAFGIGSRAQAASRTSGYQWGLRGKRTNVM
jgi:hypothetical protein